jgi:proline iminopeptidase
LAWAWEHLDRLAAQIPSVMSGDDVLGTYDVQGAIATQPGAPAGASAPTRPRGLTSRRHMFCDDGRVPPHPVIEPFDHGMLDVGDGHRLYWEVAGNAAGNPAVILHGGPGSGSSARTRAMFDPERYLIVQFDQRQCGRSTPHASEPVADLSTNTTTHLIADIERLRAHLGVERWLTYGGSWGTTLALAYAQAHPTSVSEMILASVVTTTHAEVAWVTRAMGRVFPRQWEQFRDGVPVADRDGNLAAAYARLLQDPDPAVHEPAASKWCAWEDTHVGTYPGHRPDPRYRDPRFRLCFARLVTHYWSNAAFIDDGTLVRDAHRLAGIPVLMVHGQLDISGPLDVPCNLATVLPDAELVVIGDEGHSGGTSMLAVIVAATDRLARGSLLLSPGKLTNYVD